MKNKLILMTTLAALLPLAGFSQSPAPSAAPSQPAQSAAAPPEPPAPPAPPMPRHPFMHREDRPKGPVTFLGVETSEVPRVLSEQLGLPRGFGVVVDYVVPESAAAAAGLEQNDVIRMLNDQMIVDPDQLGKLIRSFPEGTAVNLTLLRKGKEMKVTATLKKHEAKSEHGPYGLKKEWKFKNEDGDEDFDFDFDIDAPDMTSVREAVSRAKDEVLRAKDEALRAGDEARKAVRRLRIVTTDGGNVAATHVDLGNMQVVLSDDRGELTIECKDGKKLLTARDAKGNLVFSGPVNTKEDRDKVPAEVRERFEKLEKQDLPAVPPAPAIAPEPPEPAESVQVRAGSVQACAAPEHHRTGWVRDTAML